MSEQRTKEKFIQYFNSLSLGDLRVLGRCYGVAQSTAKRKEELVDGITAILTGETEPAPRSNRGAPVKRDYLDPAIVKKIESIKSADDFEENVLEVSSGYERVSFFNRTIYSGNLELGESGGILHVSGGREDEETDIEVSAEFISKFELREGDLVAGTLKAGIFGQRTLDTLSSINGKVREEGFERPNFEKLTPAYPLERFSFVGNSELFPVEAFVPIGKGQRVLVSSAPQTGRTTFFLSLAERMRSQGVVVYLALGLRPEDAVELSQKLRKTEFFSSTFDDEPTVQRRVVDTAFAYCKRLLEEGENVVLFMDGLSAISKAFREDGAQAVKRLFGLARRAEEGGSITVFAGLSTTTRTEEELWEELFGTENCVINLSSELAQKGIFPSVDFTRSQTRRGAELLQDEKEAVEMIRQKGLPTTKSMLSVAKKSKTVQEFLQNLLQKLGD